MQKLVASELLLESLSRHAIHLSLLVADTGLWVNPAVHERQVRETGGAAMSPNVRRARLGKGESRGQVIDGIRLDDNTYANSALKRALGLGNQQAQGFEVCHIWPRTCYDERYHTAVANLVLLPRALAGLSDHDDEIQRALQYRAFELYGWWPQGQPRPVRPDFYPSVWRDPEPDPLSSSVPRSGTRSRGGLYGGEMSREERALLSDRIRKWSAKPHLNVHKMIALVVRSEDGISRGQLVQDVERVTRSKNAYGAVAQLLTTKGNAYGRVFEDVGGRVRLHPAVADEVLSFRWSAA